MHKSASITHSLVSGFLAGFLGGQFFLVVGLARYSDELLALSYPGLLTGWILIRSVALYGLLGSAAGILLSVLLHVAFGLLGRAEDLVFPTVLSIMVAGTGVAYWTAWRQIEVYVGLPFNSPARTWSLLLDVSYSVVAGAVSLLLIIWIRKKVKGRVDLTSTPRLALALLILAGGALLAANYALRLREPLVESPGGARPVLVLGVDAGSFRVLGPMMRDGDLPTFSKLVEEGAWGTFLTYGTAYSPIQWTSMATGKKVADHGIYGFVAPNEGTSVDRLLTSRDRKVEAVWHMVGDHGLRVGVIDWLMTYPPEEVNGYMISRLQIEEANRAYPASLEMVVEAAIAEQERSEDLVIDPLLGELDRLFDVATRLEELEPVDLLMLFEATTDEAEHRFWKYYEPESFDRDLWEIHQQDVDMYGSVIQDTYRLIDHRLGLLLEELGDDSLVIIVSDHGQRAASTTPVYFRVDQLLEAMGMLEFTDSHRVEGAEAGSRETLIVDFERSRAYSALPAIGSPVIGINVNLDGREPTGTVDLDEADDVIKNLAAGLQGITFQNGESLLGRVSTSPIGDGPDGPRGQDITIPHSEFTRGPTALEAARSGRKIIIDEHAYPLSQFIAINAGLSGSHEREGVIFVAGKGVRRGFIGQTVATTAVQALFRHLTDKVRVADTALPVLRRLGMIDQATTLDVTPTILYALGLPIGEDMAGRPLTEVIKGPVPQWIASYDDPNRVRTPLGAGEADEDVLKRLRALGYIQ